MSRTARTRLAVALQVLAGAVAVLLVAVLAGDQGLGPGVAFAGFVLALVATHALPLHIPRWGNGQEVQLEEAFLVPMALLLSPLGVLLAPVIAMVVATVVRRRNALKAVFNWANTATAMGVALLVMRTVYVIRPGHVDGASVLAALAGAAAFAVYGYLSVNAMIAIASGRSLVESTRESFVPSFVASCCSASLGTLAGMAVAVSPWAPALALPLLAVMALILRRHVKAQQDRTRLDGLLHTAIEAHASMGVPEVENAICESASSLLQSRVARLREAPPEYGELGAQVHAGERPRWLIVSERPRFGMSDTADQNLLDGIAAIGAAALQNAHLLEQVKHQAFHDALTGLPNQVLFEDRVNQAIARAERNGERVAVLFLDLDRFKRVNDSLGHAAGDELLRQVSRWLSEQVRAVDTLSRMGGDEFTMLLVGLEDTGDAAVVAEKLLAALRRPFSIEDESVFVTASIGVAVYPDDGRTHESLLRTADLAMYQAKQRGRDRFEMATSEEEEQAHVRLALESDLHSALDRGQLWVAYQPQVDLRTGAVVGMEALLRWEHPTLGPVVPDQFIPIAEETGLVAELDTWVMQTACAQAARWARLGMQWIHVAVNLSARQLRSENLIATVMDTLATTGLDPSQLEIELTERVAAQEGGSTMAVLQELRSRGVRVAIDDFGTGYSALSRLQAFPVDVVKIDKSFVSQIVAADDDAPIVAATIAMAHSLGLQVVAEGVETPAQQAFLVRHGCDIAQGYLLGRPAPAAELERMLRAPVPALTR